MPPNQRRAFPAMDDSAAISLGELSNHKDIALQNEMRVSIVVVFDDALLLGVKKFVDGLLT